MSALVLVIDDDPPILESLAEVLSDEGYAVATAHNGAEALAYLADHTPDCILLDVMMPVMNGYEFRRLQLRDSRLAAIPTLLLTAGHLDGRVAELRLSGWLRKPINLSLLLACIGKHCQPRQREQDQGAEPTGPFAGHVAHLYRDPSRMIDDAARFLADGLHRAQPVLVGLTREHWAQLQERLAALRLDPVALQRQGQLHWLDARDVVQQMTGGQQLAPTRARQFIEAALERVSPATAGRTVRVFGEAVDVLWSMHRRIEARELERIWNQVGVDRPLSLRCAYRCPDVDPTTSKDAADGDPFADICAEHSQVQRDERD